MNCLLIVCDNVFQAAVENVPLKRTIFNVLEKICPPHCILAVNASSIDLNVIGEGTNLQERVVGAHFFMYDVLLIPQYSYSHMLARVY